MPEKLGFKNNPEWQEARTRSTSNKRVDETAYDWSKRSITAIYDMWRIEKEWETANARIA